MGMGSGGGVATGFHWRSRGLCVEGLASCRVRG